MYTEFIEMPPLGVILPDFAINIYFLEKDQNYIKANLYSILCKPHWISSIE